MTAIITCMHLGCRCTTMDEFCGPYCREHGEGQHEHAGPEPGCGCGHDACAVQVAAV